MSDWMGTIGRRHAIKAGAIDAERERITAEEAARQARLDAEAKAITARAMELEQILSDITNHRRGRND